MYSVLNVFVLSFLLFSFCLQHSIQVNAFDINACLCHFKQLLILSKKKQPKTPFFILFLHIELKNLFLVLTSSNLDSQLHRRASSSEPVPNMSSSNTMLTARASMNCHCSGVETSKHSSSSYFVTIRAIAVVVFPSPIFPVKRIRKKYQKQSCCFDECT